eukprot:721232-Amphidinium_carterae.2
MGIKGSLATGSAGILKRATLPVPIGLAATATRPSAAPTKTWGADMPFALALGATGLTTAPGTLAPGPTRLIS